MRINLLPKKRTIFTWLSERTLADLLFIPLYIIVLAILGMAFLIPQLTQFVSLIKIRLQRRCQLHGLLLKTECHTVVRECIDRPSKHWQESFVDVDKGRYFPNSDVPCSITGFFGWQKTLEIIKYCPRCRVEEWLYENSPIRQSSSDDYRRRFDISEDWRWFRSNKQFTAQRAPVKSGHYPRDLMKDFGRAEGDSSSITVKDKESLFC